MVNRSMVTMDLGQRLLDNRTGGAVPLQGQVLEAELFLAGQPDGQRLEPMLALRVSSALHATVFTHGHPPL